MKISNDSLRSLQYPTLLIPQAVQGLSIKINNEPIFTTISSNKNALHSVYHPLLVSFPKTLLKGELTTVDIEQFGHLRGWFFSPVMVGNFSDLKHLSNTYDTLSNKLPFTINLICGLIGVFFLFIGAKFSNQSFLYSGLTAVIWSLLFALALIEEISAPLWPYWRGVVYALTGNLIWSACLFTASIFKYSFNRHIQLCLFVVANLGWLVFAVVGNAAQPFLDVFWTGLAISIYVVLFSLILAFGIKSKQWKKLMPMCILWVVSSIMAIHDYFLQAGPEMLFSHLYWQHQLDEAIWLQPIYASQLTLFAFVCISIWLLLIDYQQREEERVLYEAKFEEQRSRILGDLHDGVGSRLNLILWSLRTRKAEPVKLEHEIQQCADELRFVINPPEANILHLRNALETLCKDYAKSFNTHIEFSAKGHSDAISPEIGVQIYKAAAECVSNAIRHAECSRIDISLCVSNETIKLSIRDNGKGIPDWNQNSHQSPHIKPTSQGLKHLRQRIHRLNGKVSVSSDRHGTLIDIEIMTEQSALTGPFGLNSLAHKGLVK